MFRVRCSSLSTLLEGCGKVKNKLEWENLDKMTDSHIKLAIEIYNKEVNDFEPADVYTLQMRAGTLQEYQAIKMYDEYFGTRYQSYQKVRINNEFIEGERDFGDDNKTIDCKISTDKNTFDMKRFLKQQSTDYIIQLNGYALLYDSKEIELYNALMNPLPEQIDKMVRDKMYICKLDLLQEQEYRNKIEMSYCYDFLPLKTRIQTHKLPIIDNFKTIIETRVKRLNKWIEENKSYL